MEDILLKNMLDVGFSHSTQSLLFFLGGAVTFYGIIGGIASENKLYYMRLIFLGAAVALYPTLSIFEELAGQEMLGHWAKIGLSGLYMLAIFIPILINRLRGDKQWM